MRGLIEKFKKRRLRGSPFRTTPLNGPNSQDGSIIVIALMILAVMTVIGLMAADTVTTDKFIVRNTGIHKQNASLVEAAVMEGLQEIVQIADDDPANFDVDEDPSDWLNDKEDVWITNDADGDAILDWYDNDSARMLNATNSEGATDPNLLTIRGENNLANLRYAMVGWDSYTSPSGGSASLVVSGPGSKAMWRTGRILSEYVSLDGDGDDHGFATMRMEIGFMRKIPIN